MEAIQKLRETKNKKMVELDELKHELMLLESFCNSEELVKRVSKQWMKFPQVDVHWRINMDVFGCIYSFVDLKVHPTGINDVYDELPEKFNVMKGLNGDKEAILDTVGAIASKAK